MRGLLIAVMLVAACGEDNGSGGPYVPLDQIDQGYKTAECKHLVMCGEFADQSACEAANLTVTFTVQQSAVDAVLKGRMYYKGDVLAACFDKIATRTCDTTDADGRFDTVCTISPFRGAQHAGDPCALDDECISGVCNGGGGQGSNCIDGACVGDTAPVAKAPAPIGMPCALGTGSGPSCVMGGFCDFNSSTCVALKANGTACNTANECDYGLGCVGSPTRTCKPLPVLNQPCPDFTCRDEGQVCGGAATTCTAYALPGASCASATCSPYYTCDFTTTMKCIPYPILGQSCASTSRCGDAVSYCDMTLPTAMCVALKANGAACTNSNQCVSDFCDTVNGSVCAVTTTCT